MCSNVEFCADCRPTNYMEAWMRGDAHERPQFGDMAQTYVATKRRRETFLAVMATGDHETAKAFPEYLPYMHSDADIIKLARRALPYFDSMCARNEEFAEHVREHSKQLAKRVYHGCRRRKQRQALRDHREWIIRLYAIEKGLWTYELLAAHCNDRSCWAPTALAAVRLAA